MELRHLKYFLAVAEELHFGRAAKRLNISQPPLSSQINQLEEEIGAKLLSRNKRNVELTEAGKHFLEKTYQILKMLDKTCEETREIDSGIVGELNIGFTGLWNKYLINFLFNFRSSYPDVKPVLYQMSTSDQLQSLKERQTQIGFLCPPIDTSFLNFHLIHRFPFVVALPASHPLAHDDSLIDVLELKNESFIMTDRKLEPGYYDTIISLCNQAGFTPRITQEASGVFTILSLVATGLGVTIVSSLSLEYKVPGVVYKELKGDLPNIEYTMVWRKDEDSPIVKNFCMMVDKLLNSK
jgi:DNA-binding transcriptional LysR family regulator